MMKHGLVTMIRSRYSTQRHAMRIAAVVLLFLILAFNYDHIVNSSSTIFEHVESSGTTPKVSRLHFLIPSSLVKPPLCAVVASALANRYPIPTIVGYKGEGEFDAKAAHIAKLRSIKRYLLDTPDVDDDDLVIVVDGFDVLAQVPVDALIERYFQKTAEADQQLADQRGISVDELHAQGMRQTVLFGADKGCFPQSKDPYKRDARCWLVPSSTLPRYKWGPKTENGELVYSESKYLNSGTVIGPLGDLRDFINASLDLIDESWDEEYHFRNSDQYYLSTLYARQEYHRMLDLTNGVFPLEVGANRSLPALKTTANDTTDYHVFVDFDSSFTQTQCHNNRFMMKLKYDSYDLTATTNNDAYEEGRDHRPFTIQMPSFIYKAFIRLYEAIPAEEKTDKSASQWVRSLNLGTNIGTRHIYAIYHNTCSKKMFVDKYQHSWYFPLIRPLLRAAVRANLEEEPLHPTPIGGRMWIPSAPYPLNEENGQVFDEFGGVFTDFADELFIPLSEFCSENLTAIIG